MRKKRDYREHQKETERKALQMKQKIAENAQKTKLEKQMAGVHDHQDEQ